MHIERIRIRPLISLTLAFSFLFSLVSGIALYLRPEGALARWLDWTWLGIDKKSWETIHIGAVLLLLISGIWHSLLNWKILLSYMRKRGTVIVIHWKESLIALTLTLFFALGPLIQLTPISQLITLRGAIKNGETQRYPLPPVSSGEQLTLSELSDQLSISLKSMINRLNRRGIRPSDTSVTLSDLAAAHHLSPAQIYQILLAD